MALCVQGRNPRGTEAPCPSLCPVHPLTAKEGQVTVRGCAERSCKLCHSCQPFCLEKVSSPDTGGGVTISVHGGIPNTLGTETQQHPTLPSVHPYGVAEEGLKTSWLMSVGELSGFSSFRKIFRSPFCHTGGARVLRDFMAVGVVALLLIPHDGLLWLKLD